MLRLLIVIVMLSSAFLVVAQDAPLICADILLDYRTLIAKETHDLNDLAQLQSWRRSLESADSLPCDEVAYDALLAALNLAGDAVVSELLEAPDEAAGFFADSVEYDAIAAPLVGVAPPEGGTDGPIPVITAPEDGSEVEYETDVEGTYVGQALGEGDDLWILLLAENNRYYPQAFNGCGPDRSSVVYRERQGRWVVKSFFAASPEEGIGEEFEVDLVVASPEATQALWAYFDASCPNNFPGLTQAQIDAMELEFVDFIFVTRK